MRWLLAFAAALLGAQGQKSLEIDTVKVLLPMVLPSTHPHVAKLLEFLDRLVWGVGFGVGVLHFLVCDSWVPFRLHTAVNRSHGRRCALAGVVGVVGAIALCMCI